MSSKKRKSSAAATASRKSAKRKPSKATKAKQPALTPVQQAIKDTNPMSMAAINGVEGSKHIPSLINLLLFPLEEDTLDEEAEKNIVRAVALLRQAFLMYSEQGDLPVAGQAQEQQDQRKKGKKPTPAEIAQGKFRQYLKEQLKGFVSVLLEWLTLSSIEQAPFQVLALRTLMDLVGRVRGIFDSDLFTRVTRALVQSPHLSVDMGLVYLQEYARKYGDVHYYALRSLGTVAIETARDESRQAAGAAPALISQNIFNLLSRISMPISEDILKSSLVGLKPFVDEANDVTDSDPEVSEDDNSGDEAASAEEDEDAEESEEEVSEETPLNMASWASLTAHQKYFSKAWASLLKLPLSDFVYKHVLKKMEKDILPFLARPLALSDFLTSACDAGGEAGLLALGPMYILISQHGFDYPMFYTKLYAILTPDLFFAKYRMQFFDKLSLFMTSTRLPVQTAGSFCKRLARLALSGPPSGALYALPLIFNTLKRHPIAIQMIHREEGRSTDDETSAAQRTTVPTGADPFRPEENDPLKTHALESSLWEVEALKKHPNPSVATLAKSFNHEFSRKFYEMKNFSSSTYKDLFDQAIGAGRKRNAALCYQEPAGLFADATFMQNVFST